MIYSACGHTDEPKAYNDRIAEYRWEATQKGYSTGCVGARACESCGTINGGTCLCIGIFTCCKCGFENGQELKAQMNNIRKAFEENKGKSVYINGEVINSTPPAVDISQTYFNGASF